MSYVSDAMMDAQEREIEKFKTENTKLRELVLQLVTPKQTIATTVDAGMLTAEQVRECVKEVYFEGYNDGATHKANGIEETDWQAIADKLNATFGAKTCQIENAKLRNLVDGLTWCYDHYYCRQECPLYDVSESDHCREVSIKHELGIEVK